MIVQAMAVKKMDKETSMFATDVTNGTYFSTIKSTLDAKCFY